MGRVAGTASEGVGLVGDFEYVYLKNICDFEKGSRELAKAIPGKYPLVNTGTDRRTCETFQFNTKAACIPLVSSTGHGHVSLKNVHYQEGKFALGTILVALTAKDQNVLNIQFLHLYLYQFKNVILVPLMSGAANVTLSLTKIKDIRIPLPPIDRQREIVSKFRSISSEDEELKEELTHQQTLLKKLRQQILQEAIKGKLTADWRAENPDVEPAGELLARIQAEKAQLIKDQQIKKQNPLPPIREDEKPFELPVGWAWCRLGNISINSLGKM
jgi:type I restriction enzyme, S subunit